MNRLKTLNEERKRGNEKAISLMPQYSSNTLTLRKKLLEVKKRKEEAGAAKINIRVSNGVPQIKEGGGKWQSVTL